MQNHQLPYVLAIATLLFVGAGCSQAPATTQQTAKLSDNKPALEQNASGTQIVGGDRDEHGCIGSAGYSWCASKVKCLRTWEEQCPMSTSTDSGTTIMISNADTTKFCDGDKMDSAGFKKTIVSERKAASPSADLSKAEYAKAIAILATTGQCQTALQQTDFTLTDETISIAPIEGWAGSSIAFCSCKPLVEVNLLRLPGIKKVVWSDGAN